MRRFRLRVQDRIYDVQIPAPDENPLRVRVNGEEFFVNVEEPAEAQVAPARTIGDVGGGPQTRPQQVNGQRVVSSPLPGTIARIAAHVGQPVRLGDELLTIEAMKMLNVIRATSTGTIAAIHVSVGEQVAHGDRLVTLAPN